MRVNDEENHYDGFSSEYDDNENYDDHNLNNNKQYDNKANDSPKRHKLFLITFYVMIFLILIVVYFLFLSNRYAFYLKKSEVLIKNGSEYQVELLPKYLQYFDYLNYKYEIDNDKVATVDQYGTISTVGEGEANLKIKMKYGIGSKILKIRSENTKIDSIELKADNDGKLEQKSNISMFVGESVKLRSFANKKGRN